MCAESVPMKPYIPKPSRRTWPCAALSCCIYARSKTWGWQRGGGFCRSAGIKQNVMQVVTEHLIVMRDSGICSIVYQSPPRQQLSSFLTLR